MRIESHEQVKSFTAFDVDGLDPVTVVLQDLGRGRGRMLIECWGNAYSAYWGAMGEQTIGQFVSGCSLDYLVSKLIPTDRRVLKREEKRLTTILRAAREVVRSEYPKCNFHGNGM